MAKNRVPLVVDLDNSFLAVDSLFELLIFAIRKRWTNMVLIIKAALKGRQRLKRFAADFAPDIVKTLPINPAVAGMIDDARRSGRPVVLATASHRLVAQQVSEEIGPFDYLVASDDAVNMKGPVKAETLVEMYGAKGFDYVGDALADIPVMREARTSYLVSPGSRVENSVRGAIPDLVVLGEKSQSFRSYIKLLRPHQWVKNLLVVVPALGAQVFGFLDLITLLLGIIVFSLVASGLYAFNDALDVVSDRGHPDKKTRPIAAGKIGVLNALGLSVTLMTLGLGFAFYLEAGFGAVLLSYAVISFSYSISLKKKPLADIFTLSLLYLLRIVAGAVLVSAPLSLWLVTFGLFVFLSLALAKRYTEFLLLSETSSQKIEERGYLARDSTLIGILGVSTGVTSALLLALYVAGPTLGSGTQLTVFWLAVPIWLFWIARLWMFAFRGRLHSDPVVFAVRDLVSLLTAGLLLVLFILHSV